MSATGDATLTLTPILTFCFQSQIFDSHFSFNENGMHIRGYWYCTAVELILAVYYGGISWVGLPKAVLNRLAPLFSTKIIFFRCKNKTQDPMSANLGKITCDDFMPRHIHHTFDKYGQWC